MSSILLHCLLFLLNRLRHFCGSAFNNCGSCFGAIVTNAVYDEWRILFKQQVLTRNETKDQKVKFYQNERFVTQYLFNIASKFSKILQKCGHIQITLNYKQRILLSFFKDKIDVVQIWGKSRVYFFENLPLDLQFRLGNLKKLLNHQHVQNLKLFCYLHGCLNAFCSVQKKKCIVIGIVLIMFMINSLNDY